MPQNGTGEATRIARAARKRFDLVRDDPEGRYTLAESFYAAHPVPGPDRYGSSELAFMRWEIERGVLNPPHHRTRPGSPWWRKVNERILRDQEEGGMLADAGVVTDRNPAANRWSEYLADPSPSSWYRAHNSSVVSGYVRAASLATRERPAEQFLMNLVLARVLFAQALAEEAPFAAGEHPFLAALLSDPRLPAVGIVMQVPDFYPRTYPLDAGEQGVLERRAHAHDDESLAAIDAEPCSNLDELFLFVGTSLAEPDLRRFLDRGLACYPHGLLQAAAAEGPRLWLPWLASPRDDSEGRWTDELLDRMRMRGDPEADEVVTRYFEESADAGPKQFFQQLVTKPDPVPEECSPAVADYLAEQPPLPSWADPDRIRAGEEFFGRWGLYVPLVLICSSLPECYGAAKGVQVLHLTARLASDTRRRIVETAQMVIDVMTPGGMEPGAAGYRTVRRVRLMHAGVRYLIQHDPRVAREAEAAGPRWSPDWGVPVNQEDLAGTLATFSWSVIGGLRSLGVPVSSDEADAYLHAWNVVGAMLGVREELLARDCDDADALTRRIRERQWGPSPEGAEMARALVQMLDASAPGRIVPGFSGSMIRHFVGDELADMLDVPRPSRARGIVRRASALAIAAGLAQQHSRVARALAGATSRALLRSYMTFDRGVERTSFAIPTHLAESWNVRRGAGVR
jgi:mpaB/rubber oxygenase-like protein